VRGVYDIDFVTEKLSELLAEPSITAETRLLLAAAAAVAAQIEAETTHRALEPNRSGLSPWVAAQRSTLKW
jgi:hypothetical protein